MVLAKARLTSSLIVSFDGTTADSATSCYSGDSFTYFSCFSISIFSAESLVSPGTLRVYPVGTSFSINKHGNSVHFLIGHSVAHECSVSFNIAGIARVP